MNRDQNVKKEVEVLVDKLLQDTSIKEVLDTNISELSQPERNQLLKVLKGKDFPILSTGDACGPG